MAETYVSVDVETDGPIPGPHSMLSFGAAAFSERGEMLGTNQANLVLLDGAAPDPATTEFWADNQAAYAETRVNLKTPESALGRFVEWTEGLPGKPVFVAYPAGFDFLFMYWYMIRFVGRSPFSFSALDIKSYAMACLNFAVPRVGEAQHAKGVVSGSPAHPRRARRRDRARRAVHQHASGKQGGARLLKKFQAVSMPYRPGLPRSFAAMRSTRARGSLR